MKTNPFALRWLRVLLAVVLAMSVGACKAMGGGGDSSAKPGSSGASKELKAKAKSKLEKLAALYAKAKAVPPVETDSPELSKKLSYKQYEVLGLEYLKDPNRDADKTKELDFEPTMLSLCSSGVAKDADEKLAEYVEECSKLEYVAVIRQRELSLPVVDMAKKQYDAGEFRGDVLLYEIDSGELKGSYKIVVSNSAEIQSETGKSKEDWESSAIIDLAHNAEKRGTAKFASL